MAYASYQELDVWQCSMDFVEQVYRLVAELPSEERYALGDQMRRAVVSIPSNIAEGSARNSKKEFCYFLSIATGSVAEIETRLLICVRLGYLPQQQVDTLLKQVSVIRKMLYRLSQSLQTQI